MKKICATASVILLFALCDVAGAEEKKVAKDELERQLHAAFVERGSPAVTIDCPDALDKEQGAKVECAAVFYALEKNLTVTFDRIEGDVAKVQIVEEPTRITPTGLIETFRTYLEERGTPADSIDCPAALDADKGAQVECTAAFDGLEHTATVTSKGPNGDTIEAEYAVAGKPNRWPRDWLVRQIETVVKNQRGAVDAVDCPATWMPTRARKSSAYSSTMASNSH